MRNISAGVLAILLAFAKVEAQTPDVSVLVESNRSAIESIRAIDVKLAFTMHQLVGPPEAAREEGEPKVWLWRWTKRGDLERVRYQFDYIKPTAPGQTMNLGDMIQDGRTRKVLTNWDPANPQPITPMHPGTVTAMVLPQTPEPMGWFPDPATILNIKLLMNGADTPRSLAEVVKVAPNPVVKGRARVGEYDTWHLHADQPATEATPKGSYFDVYLDPAANFMIRKVVAHTEAERMPGGMSLTTDFITEVVEFRDCGEGAFVPVRIEQRSFGGGSNSVMRVRTEDLVVNRELPSDALDFRFPKYA